jgi:predicted RNase H-like nuclease (RuvC/YqgF family)
MTENQFNEMFRMVSQTANKVQEIGRKIDSLEQGQAALQQGQAALQQGQDELRQEFEDFREETQENFDRLGREERLEVRRFKTLTSDMVTTRAQIDDLTERVELLEERNAA